MINPVFIHSQNKVLVFSKQTGHIWSYDFGLKIWKELKNGLLLPKCLRYKEYQVNITMDERYVLFMPQMIMFDLMTLKFYGNGDIKLPSNDAKDDDDEKDEEDGTKKKNDLIKKIKRKYNSIIMGGFELNERKIVTFGFISNDDGLNIKNVPMDIIELISIYWIKDYVYLMDYQWEKEPNLWRIFVDDILHSNLKLVIDDEEDDRHL